MRISVYVIDVRIPRWLRSTAPLAALGLVWLGTVAVVRADTALPQEFVQGETLTAARLNDHFKALTDAINDPDPVCPLGYERQSASVVLCSKGDDEVVKVGFGASAFWVDRYESSVWNSLANPTSQYGAQADDYPNSFPDTGQWTAQLYAMSRAGVLPSRNLTWFQANEACRASGKRLSTGSEWLAAAKGTPDDSAKCNITSTGPRQTGQGSLCASSWGAQDMIGNVNEWSDEWAPGPGDGTPQESPWPSSGVSGSYGADRTINLTSSAYGAPNGGLVQGIPSGIYRGGCYDEGSNAGLFSLGFDSAPSYWSTITGFRCVVPKG